MSVITKKIQLIPCGDKEEIDRVYQYLRDGIYNQHRILNTYMSQLGTLYYLYDRDISNVEFKEKSKEIFRNKNSAIFDIEQAKGLGMAGNCGMRVKQDFSTALKNGLARGERSLPYYKRDFPLLVPSRFLLFSEREESYTPENGEETTTKAYFIKFVNGINFKVIMGSKGHRDYYLTSLLDNIVNDPDVYHVCGSSIQFAGKKIILNLSVRIDKEVIPFVPIKNRVMSVVLGYDQPLIAAFSDSGELTYIGDDIKDSIIERRQAIQAFNRRLYQAQKIAKGGHGRKRKLRRADQQGHYEKNVVKNFNHLLSNKVVSLAAKNKVEKIVIDDLSKDDLKDKPVLLRNWTYYQLVTYIEYKAKALGITVIKADATSEILKMCCECGNVIEDLDSQWLNQKTYTDDLSFVCPCCNKTINFRYNKAKNLALLGSDNEKKKKGSKKAKAKKA